MATSGTVGVTKIKTAKVIEKAFRRCGLSPQQLTPEYVDNALEDLYMLLMSMATRGINLWCVEKNIIPTVLGQATYTLPIGTLEILDLLHARPFRREGDDTTDPLFFQTELTEAERVVRMGVSFSVLPTDSFVLQYSEDGIVWTTQLTVSQLPTETGIWNWYDLTQIVEAQFYRVQGAALGTVADLYLVGSVREIQITQFNRDDYANQPNKSFSSATITNFYFEKLMAPQITVWPIPQDDEQHIVLYRHRQVQDIGKLTEELEIPDRWFEAITWHLALRIAFEVPGVEPSRREEVKVMAGSMTLEVELGETDRGPINWVPDIGPYTR